MSKGFLRVRNLEKYQHYKDRKPPWVKLHRDFWTDYELRRLRMPSRLLSLFLVSLASEDDNRIPWDDRFISERSGIPVRGVREGIEELWAIGFLAEAAPPSDSSVLADRYQDASPKAEAEEETVNGSPRTSASFQPPPAVSMDKRFELERLLRLANDVEGNSFSVLSGEAALVPMASLVKVRESVERKRLKGGSVGVGYLVSALRKEREEAA